MTECNRTILGHGLEFSGCEEVCQGGPLACALSIDGEPVERRLLWIAQTSLRFDPSPLEYHGTILIPMLQRGGWASGYVLTRIDPTTRRVFVVSKKRPYMKLLRIEAQAVIFASAAYGSDTGSISLR